MEKQNNCKKIKIVLLDIFPSIEDLETSQNELVIIFQDNNSFYSVNKLLTNHSEIIFTTELSSIIISLIKKDYILATCIFRIKEGEQWLTFSYENQKKNAETNLALCFINCIKIKIICEVNLINTIKNDINNNKNKIYQFNKKIEKFVESPGRTRFFKKKETFSKDISKEYSKEKYNSVFTEENKKAKTFVEKKLNKIDIKNLKSLIQSPNKKKIINMDEIMNTFDQKLSKNSNKEDTNLKKLKSKKLIKPLYGLKTEKNNNKCTNILNKILKSQRAYETIYSIKYLSSRSNKNFNMTERNAKTINSINYLLNDDKNSNTIKRNSKFKNENKKSKNESMNNNKNIPKYTAENFYSNIALRKKSTKFFLSNSSFNIKENKNDKNKNTKIKEIYKNKCYFNNIEINDPFSSRRLKSYLVKKIGENTKSSNFSQSIDNCRKNEPTITKIKNNKTYTYNSGNDSDFNNEKPDNDEKLDSNFFKLKEDYILLYNEEYLQNIQDDLLKLEIELFVEKTIALIYEYHTEIQISIIENKVLENYLRDSIKKYFGINKLANKLFIVKGENKNTKFKKNKNNIDKLNSNNLNLNKNEIEIFKLLLPTKNDMIFNSIYKKETLKNIINILLNKIENRELIINQNQKYKEWIEKNCDFKNCRGLFKAKIRAIPTKYQKDNSSKFYNKSSVNFKNNDKNIHYNSHSHEGKKEVITTYVKKSIISPANPQNYYYRRKIYKQ